MHNEKGLSEAVTDCRLRPRILIPLLLTLVVVGAAFTLALDWNQERDQLRRAEHKALLAGTLFADKLNRVAESLSGLLEVLRDDQKLAGALRAGDRRRLQAYAGRLFPLLQQTHQVTHWYFSRANRVNLLRVHDPSRFGDTIGRFTTLEAARTGHMVWGLELGRSGTLTLRVVAPWFEHGRLFGFVELGTDAGIVLEDLSQVLSSQLLILLDKRRVTRTDWEVGQQMLGNASDWALFDDWVISGGSSAQDLPQTLSRMNRHRLPLDGETVRVELDNKTSLVRSLPLANVTGEPLGRILLALDTSVDRTYIGRLKKAVMAALVLAGGVLFLVLFRVSEKAQNQLSASRLSLLEAKNELERRVATRTRELRCSEEKYRQLVESANSIILRWDTRGCITFINRYAQDFFGYSAAEVMGRNVMDTIVPQIESGTRRDLCEMITDIARNPERYVSNINENVRRDGSRVWVAWANQAIRDTDGGVVEILSIGSDVTKKRQAEEELRLAASLFDSSIEGIVVTDAGGRILRVNKAFTTITGYTPEQAIGATPRMLRSCRHDDEFYAGMWNRLKSQGCWQGEIWNRRQSGEVYPEWLTISRVNDKSGSPVHYVGVFADITEKKLSEERIYHLAHYDVLTELPNRVLFHDRLDRALVISRRDQTHFAILYLDLDRFKPVNDSLGHPAGDLLLQQCARRLESCVRESDTVARMGGDEFTILLQGLHDPDEVVRICTQVAGAILQALSQPFDLEGQEVFISASIGIVSCVEHGCVPQQLIRNVDTAMYHAKGKGRNQFIFYEPHMNAAAEERLRLESCLRRAIEKDEFELHYQACVNLESGRITTVEALLRWRHPDLGLLYPDRFIALAEETGLIVPIGEWVLRTAARQAVVWREHTDAPPMVAINLSPIQLRSAELTSTVLGILDETGLETERLGLEITESTFMENEQEIGATVAALSSKGINFLIDDFGTGYSSLARLRVLPVNTLKIDRSFVRDLSIDGNDASIVETIIAMANSLRLKVVAEGVETNEQLDFLRQRGCDIAQGFLIHRPEPAAQFEKMLSGQSPHQPQADRRCSL